MCPAGLDVPGSGRLRRTSKNDRGSGFFGFFEAERRAPSSGSSVASWRLFLFAAQVPRFSLSIALATLACASLAVACGGGADSGTTDGANTDVGRTAFQTIHQGGSQDGINSADVVQSALDTDNRGPTDAYVTPGDDGACPNGTHMGTNGLCTQDVCSPATSTCADLQTMKVCNDDGSAFEEIPCPTDQICHLGTCWAPICTPGEQSTVCDGSNILNCNSLGTEWVPYPCAAGEACRDGECKPVSPNILFLVDTSGSMNWLPDGTSANSCFGSGCPVWNFPNCDNDPVPLTRLGKVKEALRAVLASEGIGDMRLALQRFAQSPISENSDSVGCSGGYWVPSDETGDEAGLMTGDNDSTIHLAPADGWFGQHLDEILSVPFPETGATDLDALAVWLDNIETVNETNTSCSNASQCNGGPCLSDGAFLFPSYNCAEITNPELRAKGGTPLGKSLFYAGEYLRNFAFVEGKACVVDTDCGSSNHTCVGGACHDLFAECRPTVIIAFTDGQETENVHIDDFFHPRVQAKRLHYGLGCQSDDDCLSGATCDGTRCVPPPGVVDETASICETGGTPCTSTSDCPDPCETWAECQGDCTPAQVDVTDGNGADHLFSHAGTMRAVTIHVVDASGIPGANEDVAAYGGGSHFSVDLTDPETLVNTVNEIIGDTKSAGPCGGP